MKSRIDDGSCGPPLSCLQSPESLFCMKRQVERDMQHVEATKSLVGAAKQSQDHLSRIEGTFEDD